MKKMISNVSEIRRTEDFMNDYMSAQYLHLQRCFTYTESYYKAVTVYKRHKDISLYESVHYGKFGKLYRIMKRYDNTYDVTIENTVDINKTVYKAYVFTGNFKTLKEAVKAKYNHYKD